MPKSGRRLALSGDESSLPEAGHEEKLHASKVNLGASKVNLAGSKVSLRGSFKAPPTAKSPNKLQSLFNPFNKTQDQWTQLMEHLQLYSTTSPPSLPSHMVTGRPHFDPSCLTLEVHWTDIVHNHASLSKPQREQQEAIWELLATEVEYIRKLKVVIDLFYSCLLNLQGNHILENIETDRIFNNICDVFYSTTHFWSIHLSQVLRSSRESGSPLDPCLLKSGFQVFERIFEPYSKYCLCQDESRRYIKSLLNSHQSFRLFLNWAESQWQCSRLSLTDLLVSPFQRLTKYALLLGALKKPLLKMETTLPIQQQKEDIVKMVDQVESFVGRVNRQMRHRQDNLLISSTISRIHSYHAVDLPSEECSKTVEQFSRLDLLTPLPGCSLHERRKLLFEGSLKLKDAYCKMDVYCFLFTDMVLITKATAKRGDKVKVIKTPMRLDKIIVQSMRDVGSFMLLYLNEYSMAQAVYILHGDSKEWLARLANAQREYTAKKLSSPRFEPPKKLLESCRLDKRASSSDHRHDSHTLSSSKHHYHPPPYSSQDHPTTSYSHPYSHTLSYHHSNSPTPSYHSQHSTISSYHHSQSSTPSYHFSNYSTPSFHNSLSSTPSYHHSSISVSCEQAASARSADEEFLQIFASNDRFAKQNAGESVKDVKKLTPFSSSTFHLSTLNNSCKDLSSIKGCESDLKRHKKHTSDPIIIIKTPQSIDNLFSHQQHGFMQDDLDLKVVSSDPGSPTNNISPSQLQLLLAHSYTMSESSLMQNDTKWSKGINFRHKPFKKTTKSCEDNLINDIPKKDFEEEKVNTGDQKEEATLDQSIHPQTQKKSIPRSSTSDSNDEFFEAAKEGLEENEEERSDRDKSRSNTAERQVLMKCISNEETDDQFHLCFSPEDFTQVVPANKAVMLVETASQTSVDLLISAYCTARNTGVLNAHYRTLSLPNIFHHLPSPYNTINSLLQHNNTLIQHNNSLFKPNNPLLHHNNNQRKLSLIKTS